MSTGSKSQTEFSYWQERAGTYSKLDDVSSKRTAYKIAEAAVRLGLSQPLILDVGCGPGKITKVLKQRIRHSKAIGIDISSKMISKAKDNDFTRDVSFAELNFLENNVILDSIHPNLIVMSLFLHHMTNGRDITAVKKAFNILQNNGWLLVAEAVPPSDLILEEYRRVFSLKEDRNCYTELDIAGMMKSAGFEKVGASSYRFTVRLNSWLNDPTLSDLLKQTLYDMHVNGSPNWKKAYNMSPIPGGDWELHCKMSLVCGRKKTR